MSLYKVRPVYDIEDVNTQLQEIESAINELEPSNVPAFLNSWVNFGSTSLPVGFWKTSDGVVHLEGRMKDGTITTPAFILPRFYRPVASVTYAIDSNGVFGKVLVKADGTVQPQVPSSNVYIVLDGISFRAKAET